MSRFIDWTAKLALSAACLLPANSGFAGLPPGEQVPSTVYQSSGFLRVHDPSTIVKEDGVYWIFFTGQGIKSIYSNDLARWKRGPDALPQPPNWITRVAPGQRGYFWAPDLIKMGDRYFLYYSVSAFGKQTSAIALATTPTLNPESANYKWIDEGIVIQTKEGDDANAIDPNVIRTSDGKLWLSYGSFWSGIKLVELDPKSGKRLSANSPIYSLAKKEQIEAAAIFEHQGRYYLFVNWGWCCRGVKSTYNVRVGRSSAITGPYVDKEGKSLLDGGGTLFLETSGGRIGPGHAGVFEENGRHYFSYHFYDAENEGRPRLAIQELSWNAAGWPELASKLITPAR